VPASRERTVDGRTTAPWVRTDPASAQGEGSRAREARSLPALSTVSRTVVVCMLPQHLLDLHARIAELEAALAEVLRTDPPSQQLQGQVPGLGPTWTATSRAEVGDGQRFQRADQLVAYAGLEPRTHERGRYAGKRRLSKRGPAELRHALSMATLVAVRFCPEWRLRYQRLLDRGRAKKEARTILSRTLLVVRYHLLRTGASCDPARLSPAPLAG
jgi:transposase